MTNKKPLKISIDVKPKGIVSAHVNAPFDEGKKALERQRYHIISLEENAKLRIQEGEDSYVSRNGNWTREGVVYVPKKGIFLTKNSPIMENAKKATNCYRNSQDFYLTDKQIESSLADCVKLTEKLIPTNRFAENEITIYAFGNEKNARNYGEFLKKNAGINKMPVWLANVQDKAFVRQLWFGHLDYGSGLFGYVRYLNSGSWVCGVLNSAKNTAKNFENVYTSMQLKKALKKLKMQGLEIQILKELDKSN